MSPILIAAAVAVAGSTAAIGWLLLAPRDRTRQQVLANAGHGLTGPGTAGSGLASPAALARRVAPPRLLARLDRLWALAGRPRAWSPDRVVLAKMLLTLAFGFLG